MPSEFCDVADGGHAVREAPLRRGAWTKLRLELSAIVRADNDARDQRRFMRHSDAYYRGADLNELILSPLRWAEVRI